MIGAVEGLKGISLISKPELDTLVRILQNRLLKSTSMLEIGTYDGVSASLIAKACPNSKVLSVDPCVELNEKTKHPARPALGRISDWRHNQQSNQHLWVGTAADFHTFAAFEFDLVLVDGLHLYQNVLDDLHYSSGMLLPDGVLAVHDYRSKDWPEVQKATNEFLRGSRFVLHKVVDSMALLLRGKK